MDNSVLEVARKAVEKAKSEIGHLRAATPLLDPRYEMLDDAYIGAAWALKRLIDLEKALLELAK